MRFPVLIVKRLPANGMALFPFILLKTASLKSNQVILNHELIHIRQQLELLILPFYLLYLGHYLINRLKYKDHYTAYMAIIFEKEAYAMEKDLQYLKKRPFFN